MQPLMSGFLSRFRTTQTPAAPQSTSSASHATTSPNASTGSINTHFIPDSARFGANGYVPPTYPSPAPGPAVPGVVRLRSVLSTLPNSSWYRFAPETRLLVLKELWGSFWGPFGSWFNVDDPEFKQSFESDGNLTKAQRRFLSGLVDEEREAVGHGKCCEYVFEKGDVGYRCKDCAMDDTCVMCSRCFEASDHIGHIVTFHVAHHAGGYCDCGDNECWRTASSCRLHRSVSDNSPGPSLPGSFNPSAIGNASGSGSQSTVSQISEGLRQCMAQTVAFAVDYMLDVLDFAPDDAAPPTSEADITKATTTDSQAANVFGSPTSSGIQFPFAPFGSPTSRNGSPGTLFGSSPPSSQPQAPRGDTQYAVVVWNDEKHSFQEVIDVLQDATCCDPEMAKQWTNKIHTTGRAVVDRSNDPARALYIAKQISQVDLGVTVRRASDTFREEVAATIIEWLVDLTTARLGGHSHATREILLQTLFAPRPMSNSALKAHSNAAVAGNQSVDFDGLLGKRIPLTRVEYAFCYHTKLWRGPRLMLKQVYVSLFRVSPTIRVHMATLYAQVYHNIVNDYLLVDREAETSMRTFSDQLFSVPTVAYRLVSTTPLPQRILGLLVSFFTNQLSDGGKCVLLPPRTNVEPDVNSFPFRSKRFMPLFNDMRALCAASPFGTSDAREGESAARVLITDSKLLGAMCDLCDMFSGINPNTRQSQAHVEYETDAWVSVFNVMLCLARLIRAYGEMYGQTPPKDISLYYQAIAYTLQRAMSASKKQLETSGRAKTGLGNFHQVTFGGLTKEVVRFDVMEGYVSFHHPLHWFLAELLKHVKLLGDDSMAQAEYGSLRTLVLSKVEGHNFLVITEFSLRVLAMVAQVRAGLWVRNGFAIRGQLIHYRDFMLRELCYDQDLFLVQCGLALLDPHLVLVTILDRFQLLGWFSGRTIHEKYDVGQLGTMLEEFFYVLLFCMGEVSFVNGLTEPQQTRRDVIHALALGPCSYTELTKRVTDRIVEAKSFERSLMSVANYKPPVALSDVGMYELKDEIFDEVDHFYFHYTRNRREEIEGILKARLKKKVHIEQPVLVPKPLNIERNGPYSGISAVFACDVFVQMLFFGIFNFLPSATYPESDLPSYADIVIDQTLHLIMLALIEAPESFPHLAARKVYANRQTLTMVLCTLENMDRYKSFHPTVEWCLDLFQQYTPNELKNRRRGADTESRAEELEAAKKRAAKARQEAIMKQFQVAQQTFKLNNLDAEDEVDDTMDDFDADDMEEEEQNKPVGTCIVCQEDLTSEIPFGLLCSVMPSRVIRTTPPHSVEWLEDALSSPTSLDRKVEASSPLSPTSSARKGKGPQSSDSSNEEKCSSFPLGNTKYGLYTSVCGHMMHVKCFNAYTDSVEHRQAHHSTRNHPENISRKEFVCPLCKSLGNSLLPVQDSDWSDNYYQGTNMNLSDWIRLQQTNLLRQYQDRSFDSILCSNSTGEFSCWNTTDESGLTPGYALADGDWQLSETVHASAQFYSNLTKHLRRRPLPTNADEDIGAYLPDELVVYTLSMMEVAMRGEGEPNKTIADCLTERQSRVIRGMIYTLRTLSNRPNPAAFDGTRQLYTRAICMRILPDWARERSLNAPMLLRDPLTILVETAAIAPEMLHYIVILMYHAALMRASIAIVLMLNRLPGRPQLPADGPYHDIFGTYTQYVPSLLRHSPQLQQIAEYAVVSFGADRVRQLLYAYTLPFLRRAALLLRAVRPSRFGPKSPGSPQQSEYERLLDILNIPPPSRLYESEALTTLMDGWTGHYCSYYSIRPDHLDIKLEHPAIYRLTRLPPRLDTLYHKPQRFLCHRCQTVPNDPAICMFCGTVCCLQSFCCSDPVAEAGECNMHMRDCGGIVGMYFLVKKCAILYLHSGNGSFVHAPYADEHGEVDFNLRRARLQHLHALRYEDLRKQWLLHGIPAIVARKLEGAIDHGGWGTL
ncbi:hypothetical protein CALVIDRAFT_595883 [Calocera viscosa TUFC12733]|uniref:E3 ubiquitin-protein ligase n=1 Tax=Calocera viscosa (strain TUFC12733) TaxID=1330018 RepID=A0A167QIZ0_CALVF|nr:hypothetical protein CALVIDRAFT_595883 [Calocera viscosa TUFC12733]